MTNYARGLAFVAKGDYDNADAAIDTVRTIAGQLPPDLLISINMGGMLLRIAAQDLEGQMAAAQKQPDKAATWLRGAIATEDSLHYDEPPTFPWTIRPRLGRVLLKMGKAKEAEAEYRGDLLRHPENGWALRGLADALHAQKREPEAAEVEARFKKAWARADVTLEPESY
jgi:tetratricopeptide (TPR) repeat protein